MNDNTELKRLADELIAANDLFNESPQDNEAGDVWSLANDRFTEAASPEVILALIADNDRLESEAVYAAAGFDAAREEVARLKAENERQAAQYKEWQASHHANYCKVAEERDELRAENAGLKTGYEAYEQVNSELKAENEALRKDSESYRLLSFCHGQGTLDLVRSHHELCAEIRRLKIIAGEPVPPTPEEFVGPNPDGPTARIRRHIAAMGKGEKP